MMFEILFKIALALCVSFWRLKGLLVLLHSKSETQILTYDTGPSFISWGDK